MFLVSNCSFLFLTVYKCVISVMLVLFYNTECGNKGNKLKSCLLLLLSLFSLRLNRLRVWGSHMMNEWLKPEDSKQVNNSSTEPIGWCACATEQITPEKTRSSQVHSNERFVQEQPITKVFKSVIHFNNAIQIGILHVLIWFVFTSIMTLAGLR